MNKEYKPNFLRSFLYRVKRPWHFVRTGLLVGLPAQIRFGSPSKKLKIIAITGTDGKTTSSTLLYHILKKSGRKAALISTVAAFIGDEKLETGFHTTMPDPKTIQSLIKKMVDKNVEYLVLETTSHGIYQYRTWGIDPFIAGLTNIAHEHLDYHLTLDSYIEAKALLLRKVKTVVLNSDDLFFKKLKKLLPTSKQNILTYSKTSHLHPKLKKAIQERFPEPHNQLNARLVSTMAKVIGISNDKLAETILSFPGIEGRMQYVQTKKNITIVVDYAHTPQGLEAVLTTLRKQMRKKKNPGKLISLFGCTGLRDKAKRPVMGNISAKLADISVFTADDTYTEDVWAIISEMKQNLSPNQDKVLSIADRRKAVEFTLTQLANKGDVVALLGQGHEHTICYGTTEHPWNDAKAAKKILN